MSEATQTKTAKQLVEGVIEAIANMDADTLAGLLHPDIEVIEPENLPYGGVYNGADTFMGDLFPQITGPFELTVTEARVFEAGPDAAACNMTIVFKSRRTGEAITMPYVEVYSQTDGRISKIDVYPQDVTALTAFMDANR